MASELQRKQRNMAAVLRSVRGSASQLRSCLYRVPLTAERLEKYKLQISTIAEVVEAVARDSYERDKERILAIRAQKKIQDSNETEADWNSF